MLHSVSNPFKVEECVEILRRKKESEIAKLKGRDLTWLLSVNFQ